MSRDDKIVNGDGPEGRDEDGDGDSVDEVDYGDKSLTNS